MMFVLALLALQDPDPRARAVREAYEEQLRRERQISDFVVLDRVYAPDGLEALDRRQGVALLRLWVEGEKAYPELIRAIGGPSLEEARTAVHVLNQLTGRRGPIPDTGTQARIQAEWEQWLRDSPASCRHSEGDLRTLIAKLDDDELETRFDAERSLASCARRHKPLLEEALRGAKDVETAARLQSLLTASEPDFSIPRSALERMDRGEREEGAASLRSAAERFRGVHRATLDVVLQALER